MSMVSKKYTWTKLLSEHTKIIYYFRDHTKLLHALKWFHEKNYPIELDIRQISKLIGDGSMELIVWLLENKLVDRSIFNTDNHFAISTELKNLPAEKQLATLTLINDLGYHFSEEDIGSLLDCSIEVFDWFKTNISYIKLVDILRIAIITDKISVIIWTGINKDSPDFGSLNHKFVLERAIRYHHMDVIEWYFENMLFSEEILDALCKEFSTMYILTVEKIMQFEKFFEKYKYLSYKLFYPKIVETAINNGKITIINYLMPKLPSGSIIYIYDYGVSTNIENGNIEVLKIFEKYLFKDTQSEWDAHPVQIRYCGCNINDFKYTIDRVAYLGHLETIKWVYQFIPRRFNYKFAINEAVRRCDVDMLNWFNEMFIGDDFKYTSKALDAHCLFDKKIQMLEWFHSSGHPLKYTNKLIDNSILDKHVNILQWLKDNKYPMTFTLKSIYCACISFSRTLQWLKDNNVIIIVGRESVDNLLIFKIKLAQPFSESIRSNVEYKTIERNTTDSQFVKFTSTLSEHGTEIIEIKFNCEKIYNISTININTMTNEHCDVYGALHWFEQQYKQLIH